jgi:hypothetical protein
MPQLMGSTRPSKALAAMAASMADPPRANTWAAAWEASVWLVAAIPCLEITMDRAWERSWHWMGMASDKAAQNSTIRDGENIEISMITGGPARMRTFGFQRRIGNLVTRR